MTFSVKRCMGVIVQPSEPTPSLTLNLSVIDKMPNFRMNNTALMIYRQGGNEAAQVIRKALSMVLVPYYPVAGRLIESSDGNLHVACTGEGAWFMEASADYTLASVNYFDNKVATLTFNYDHLLPTPPPKSFGINPFVQIQVTCFICGGFVLGIRACHTILDGSGGAQFLNAIGEFARGFLQPTIPPVWLREAIPAPTRLIRLGGGDSKMAPSTPPSFPNFQLVAATVDISLDQINRLKKEFVEVYGEQCSTFDVVVADLWRYRTRAMELKQDSEVTVLFLVNAREFLTPPLPKGFYGNCVYPVAVTISSQWLAQASNSEVVKVIKEEKAKAPAAFKKWAESEDDIGDPFTPTVVYTTLCIAEWGRLGFNQVDYGWGHPEQVLPVQQGPSIMPYAIVGVPPMPNKGIRLITFCVGNAHLPPFLDCYTNGPSCRL